MLSPKTHKVTTPDAEHIQNEDVPPQRGTCLQALLGWNCRTRQFSPRRLLGIVRVWTGTQLAGSDFYFCSPRPSEKCQERLLVISNKGPAQVSQKSKPKGEGAGRACVECWTQALIRNTAALDRASLYKLLGPVFTS